MIVFYYLISALIIPFYIGISFLFSMVVVLLSFYGLTNPILFQERKEKYKSSTLKIDEIDTIMKSVKNYMVEEKPFLDPDLTLTNLSKKVGISGKKLSQAINQKEQINYSQYISRFRVEEVKSLMKLPAHARCTIAAIAYESGFSSISSFNAQFKKITNTTAKEFRESLKNLENRT